MNVKSIVITSDPTIARGGCLLETPSGDVDASIETQLHSLYQSLKEAYLS
jgi:flagellar biosynthesis/type III secretory pathway protein FliH